VTLVKRKALALTFILSLLVSLLAGTLLNQNGARTLFVKAETSDDSMVIYGDTNANVTIQSPENKTYKENNVTLAFTIESDVPPAEYMGGSGLPFFLRHGVVLDYDTYKLDTIINSYEYWNLPDNVPATLSASGNRYVGNATLTDLSQGPHNITVWIRVDLSMISYSIYRWATFSTVSFTILPLITVLSPETKAYNVSDVPLDFTVKETFSKIEYSLDGQSNVTINGNTTLTWMPNGDHNITVYATDQAGNTGVSETIRFSVEVPFPTTLVVAVSVASVVVVGVGLLVSFKKKGFGHSRFCQKKP
jgi:hypothetical protein